MKKTFVLLIPICCITLISAVNNTVQKANTLKTLILDAGHGGSDPGADCWEHDCDEANITLGVTLKLGDTLSKLMPDLAIHYTRTDDSYPSLKYRANFANEKKGDLFVSIHCNSAGPHYKKEFVGVKTVTYYSGKGRNRKKLTKEVDQYQTVKIPNPAQGMETYVWIPGKNDQKTDAIAEKENQEIFKDPNYKQNYGGGFDIKSPEFIAKAKLRTKKYFQRSTVLANLVQDEGAKVGRNDRNIKQRGVGIWVLQATAMPSVLVETGYISNPTEAAYLSSNEGQVEMAALIARAIVRYHEELQKKNNPSQPSNQEPTEVTKSSFYNNDNRKKLLV